MGKPLSDKTVEYAYIRFKRVFPNVRYNVLEEYTDEFNNLASRVITKYRHKIQIGYELKDADRNVVMPIKVMDHFTEQTDKKQNVAEYLSALGSNLSTWIAEDKYALSGYQS